MSVQVTDSFTAVALRAVFETLLNEGVVLVATANRPPDQLLADKDVLLPAFVAFASSLPRWCNDTNPPRIDHSRA
eukprot:953018-Prorocentrum_minimum.AAC.1